MKKDLRLHPSRSLNFNYKIIPQTIELREGLKWKSFLRVAELVEVPQKDWNGKPDPAVFLQGHAQNSIQLTNLNNLLKNCTFISMINRELIEPFSKLELLAKQVVEGFITGLHKSPFHGFSVEFAEHRIYNKGESTKHIDWKLFGKTDKLFIKRYEEETNLRCQIVIDTSNSMLFPLEKKKGESLNKLTFSVYAAAALMQLLKNQRDAIGITCFDKEIHKHYPAKSNPAQQKLMYHELEELLNKTVYEETSTTQSAKALDQVAEIVHRRSLIVIFSDMFEDHSNLDAIFASLQHLKYKKHDVVLFHVTDKKQELDFDFENRPHHFIDIETKQEIKLNPHQVKEMYLKKIHEYTEAIKLKCGQYKIDFVEADINQGFDLVLQTYLVKRGAMLR